MSLNNDQLKTNPTSKIIEVVSGILLNEDHQILMTCKLALDQHWEFIGGKIEPGETQAEALKREIKEEIGVEVIQSTYLHSVTFQDKEKTFVVHAWIISEYYGTPTNREKQILSWVGLDNMKNVKISPYNKPILNKILNNVYF